MSGAAGARRSTAADIAEAAPAPLAGALKGLCPRCGAPTLFDGIVKFAGSCRVCSLDYGAFNVGDGPAAFLTMIVGAIVVTGAVTLELTAHPPFWVHAIIWLPVTSAAVVLSLRVAKAWLIGAEYRNAAREGRLRE